MSDKTELELSQEKRIQELEKLLNGIKTNSLAISQSLLMAIPDIKNHDFMEVFLRNQAVRIQHLNDLIHPVLLGSYFEKTE